MRKLGYIVILVRDYHAMKEWYRDTLGLELAETDDAGQWASFKFPEGDANLAIHGGAPPTRGTTLVPSIEVSDIGSAVDELKKSKVEFVKEVHEGGGDVLLADFKDPEGNMLQIYQVGV
jgi:catechol 2,3-dioxygenase-like lactoylglutathione lyase family enzyme